MFVTFVMAATEDDCASLSSSLRFIKSLRMNGVNAKFLLDTCMHHVDFGFYWIRDATANERVFDTDAQDKARRRTAFAESHGTVAAQLKDEVVQKEAHDNNNISISLLLQSSMGRD